MLSIPSQKFTISFEWGPSQDQHLTDFFQKQASYQEISSFFLGISA